MTEITETGKDPQLSKVGQLITQDKIDKLINDLSNLPKLIKEPSKLTTPIDGRPITQEEINDVTAKLQLGLSMYGGIGLSANQIGLDVRACIINVKEPLVLINPRVTEVSQDTVAYVEQCLSIPKSLKKPVKTVRHKSFTIETDNLGTIVFSPDNQFSDWKDGNEFFNDMGLLECVCAQHEIDHLNGILITDAKRRYTTTFVKDKTYGRNEMVMVKLPDGKTEFMKYKKAQKLGAGVEIL
jgi:peptide deformylase